MPRPQSVSYIENHRCLDIGQLRLQADAAFCRPPSCPIMIDLEWRPLHFGGAKPFFLCPACGGRCRKLYAYACRNCRGLRYRTKSLSPADRAMRKAVLHRRNFGQVEGGIGEPLPEKPPDMSWEKYDQAYNKALKLDADALAKFRMPKR